MAQSGDIGIDLGTSNVVIYMKGHGVVFREPSIIAVERESSQIIAFGMEAYRMIGRTPANISIIRPLAQGEILDFDLTASMLRYYISNVIGKKFFSRPRAIMSVPSGVKEIEKKALITSMFDAGLRRTQILDRTIAAALGAQLNFLGSYGSMVADLSAGGTDLASHHGALGKIAGRDGARKRSFSHGAAFRPLHGGHPPLRRLPGGAGADSRAGRRIRA